MPTASSARSPVPLAELMAALALAMDLGTGQPLEWVIRCTLLGTRLADMLGLGEADRREVYYLSLLRHLGCTATATLEAGLFADELGLGEGLIVDPKNLPQAVSFLVRNTARDRGLVERARFLGRALAAGPAAKDTIDTIQCEAAVSLAGGLCFSPETRSGLNQVFERWDGQGVPHHLKAEAISLPVRVIQVAQDAVTTQMMSGLEAAIKSVSDHAGKILDPAVAGAFCRSAHELLGQLNPPSLWAAVIDAEPGGPTTLAGGQLEQAMYAVADFTDLKSPFLAGHSRRVAELAAQAAEPFGLLGADARDVKHAGLIHDIGRVGVTASIWNKAGPLTESEWERVRLHPNFTERIFSRAPALSELGAMAAMHHERLDGSGYHRRLPAGMLPPAARLLAAADAYCAITEPRPHRAALSPKEAAGELRREAKAGRFDGEAVQAVLSAAGHKTDRPPRARPAGLTPREVEVLRLIARGLTTRQIAQQLSIAEKTADHHIQNIYSKIGLSTRAGATLYALQNNLL